MSDKPQPGVVHVRYARPKENILIRTYRRRGTVKTALLHTGYYPLGIACLNDVGYYYCARDDKACLCGFRGRGALATHLRPNGVCERCGALHTLAKDWQGDGPPVYSHEEHIKWDDNPNPHVLVWICRYHGPETMRPMDGDEPMNLDMHPIASNEQWIEYMRKLAQRGSAPELGRIDNRGKARPL